MLKRFHETQGLKEIILENVYLLVIFLFLQSQNIFAYTKPQEVSKENDYQILVNKFYQNIEDSLKAKIYANQYLFKAKHKQDTIRIADGFYFLSLISKSDVSQKYSDSIIDIVKNKPTKFYPTYAYLNKATIYYNQGKFKRALDYFLKVNEEARINEDTYLLYSSKKNIGIIKSILGENKSALIALRECYKFYSENKQNITEEEYLEILFALSESYNFNKVLDSASLINRIGYKKSLESKNEKFKSYFILNEGINQYSKEKFVVARDSLMRSISLLKVNNGKANLGQAHFYLGKTLSYLGDQNRAINEHKNADEIFQKSSQIIPESRENYEILINYYKKKDDKDNQLKYIEKLINVDSILNSNYKYLIKNIVQNYDTPRLLSEKQKIIDSLKIEKESSFTMIIALWVLSIILSVFLILNYLKRKKYKKRFDELYNANSKNHKPIIKKSHTKDIDSIGIADDIVNEILRDLEKFEEKFGFLKPNIITNDLAKRMNTNSKYLSKVINHYKKRSFSMYINELRIDYCIEKLKTDRKFINYTIKAIAREIGFNSADSFSKSFFKIKGIQPSYFIRELEKQQKTKLQ